jgi:hypothetical protein
MRDIIAQYKGYDTLRIANPFGDDLRPSIFQAVPVKISAFNPRERVDFYQPTFHKIEFIYRGTHIETGLPYYEEI